MYIDSYICIDGYGYGSMYVAIWRAKMMTRMMFRSLDPDTHTVTPRPHRPND